MKITIEQDFEKHTIEFTNIDVTFEQILSYLTGVFMAMLGYDKQVILNEIKNFVEENDSDELLKGTLYDIDPQTRKIDELNKNNE